MPAFNAFIERLRTELDRSLRLGRPTELLVVALERYAQQLYGAGVPVSHAVDLVCNVVNQVARELGLASTDRMATLVDAVAVDLMATCVAIYQDHSARSEVAPDTTSTS